MKGRFGGLEPLAAVNWARERVHGNRGGEPCGFFSVCSAHPMVLQVAIQRAAARSGYVCIESTSNQVNQFGGYTGFTPVEFARQVSVVADQNGLPRESVLLGGDHLGPHPWRKYASRTAMQNAMQLVRACVLAGYQKIHLDASMRCADDPEKVEEEELARRAALLCQAAEEACRGSGRAPDSLMYVIGTEVPIPGGELASDSLVRLTNASTARGTLELSERKFAELGLQEAWQRVIALVVQPGVEFGDSAVTEYQHEHARELSIALPASPELVYEAHSTDYQTPAALRRMVQDHFAILKVGPWLTFAMREAIFALAAIERELGRKPGVNLSDVPGALDEVMMENPEHWKGYYQGTDSEVRFARRFSLSDRCRYYWGDERVQRELKKLIRNLSSAPIPLSLISQFLPMQYESVRSGSLEPEPISLIKNKISYVCEIYEAATER